MGHKSSMINFLPVLMTIANLLCGFAAVLCLFHGSPLNGSISERVFFYWAIGLMIAAGVFDSLDGKVARLFGQEGPFGRELDSLADLVSFGLAPAALAYRILLKDLPVAGPVLAGVYLVSCAVRLARFNSTHAAIVKPDKGKTSCGLPVPSAAAAIISLTWLTLSFTGDGPPVSWNWLLAPLMAFVSLMMVSSLSYPSSPRVRNLGLFAIVFFIVIGWNKQWLTPAVLFVIALVYAIVPPFLSLKRRDEVAEKKAAIASTELDDMTNPPSMV
jgi:CDP-diacylglycerol---serine O-phosphatidyltransferase